MTETYIDHITITAPSLELGAELVERVLGVTPQKGGEHPRMGTHNLFVRLGDSVFLEIIACNPNAEKPKRPRWFALDNLNSDSLAKLRTWVVRTENIKNTVEKSSEYLGDIEPMSRGDTTWLITIPKDGSIPLAGGAPPLIEWHVDGHPAIKMTDFGLSLTKLLITHPEPEKLSRVLDSIILKGAVEITYAKEVKITAIIDTPAGEKELCC